MREWSLPAVVAVSALALTGCSLSGDSGRPTVTQTAYTTVDAAPGAEADAGTDPAPASDAAATFADVLANPGKIPVSPAARYEPKGTYSYTFTDINADGIEDMLLRVDSTEFAPVIALRADGKGGYVASKDVLIDGAAGAGGSRAWVHATADGDGIIQEDGGSTSPTKKATRFRMEGDSLVAGEESTHDSLQPIPNAKQIDWLDTATAQSRNPGLVQQAAPAVPAGATLSGTIKVLTNAELLRGRATANGEPADQTHLVFVYDSPQNLEGSKPGSDPVTQESWFAALEGEAENAFDWYSYVDKHVTITYDPSSVTHRSDTSLPPGTQIKRVYDVQES
ncbi:hypothetical protein [Corynebacterium sp. LK2510]|uniref:hypothetical protein n=1 Tax=Corynebacterium sp. LK2510 TaxID=3110472 RepID=UPI0034CE0C64